LRYFRSRGPETKETGEEAERAIPFLKGYVVFNTEQVEGLPEHYYPKPAPRTETVRRIERAESFFAATGASVVHRGNRACYVPSTDTVHMPCIDFFRDTGFLPQNGVALPACIGIGYQ
jgi:antirestriction protein ArdC